jgi:hypothetical protein
MDRTLQNPSTSPLKVPSPLPPIFLPTDKSEGTIFDVSKKVDVYGKGKSYNLFAGKDASKALGMSSLNSEDAVSDYSTLSDDDRKVLEEWYSFFKCVYRLLVFSFPKYPTIPQETIQRRWQGCRFASSGRQPLEYLILP